MRLKNKLKYFKSFLSTFLKAIISEVSIRFSSKYKHPVFNPNKFIISHKDVDNILILGGSYDLGKHVKIFNELKDSKSSLVLGVNLAVLTGYKIDLVFYELWQKTEFRDWFDENIIKAGLFDDLAGDSKIVITGIEKSAEGEKIDKNFELLGKKRDNFYLGLERSFHLPKKGSEEAFVVNQFNDYLNKKIFLDTWQKYLPIARGSIVKAVLFAAKLKPRNIYIAGLSDGKNSLHFWDNHDDFPHLMKFAETRVKMRPGNHSRIHRTIRTDLGYWTLPRLINLLSESLLKTNIYILTKDKVLKCPLPNWL